MLRSDEVAVWANTVNSWRFTTVTFKRPGTTLSVTLTVRIYDARKDAELIPEASEYRWAVSWYDADGVYAGGSKIGTGDQIYWSELKSTGGYATLAESPLRSHDPVPFATAYFNEQGGR